MEHNSKKIGFGNKCGQSHQEWNCIGNEYITSHKKSITRIPVFKRNQTDERTNVGYDTYIFENRRQVSIDHDTQASVFVAVVIFPTAWLGYSRPHRHREAQRWCREDAIC